jgi:hypothetical protein
MATMRALRQPLRPWICALAPLAWMGCFLGGQGTDDHWECRVEERALDGDEQVSPVLGFAPADTLSWALGTRSESARWHEPPAGTTSSSMPGAVVITFAIERARGSAVEVVPEEPCGPPHVRVPVTISFSTADGQLDERWSGALTAARAGFARVAAEVDLERLHGPFVWQSASRGIALVQAGLGLSLTSTGSTGGFDAVVEMRTADAVSIGPGTGPLLSWPAESACAGEGVSRVPGEQESIYLDAVMRANERSWSDAQGREHALAISPADHLCERERGEPVLPSTVALRSPDGAVDLALGGWIRREGDALTYQPDARSGHGGSPERFAARFGDFGLTLDGFEHVRLELSVTLTVSSGHAEFRVIGHRDECEQRCDARGCSGCGPLVEDVLLEVALEQR